MSIIFADGTGTIASTTLADGGTILFRFFEVLKLAGWTTHASSDGSNFSNTPGNANDQVTSAAEMGNANAWKVMKQPTYATGVGAPGGRLIAVRRGASASTYLFMYYPLSASNVTQVASTPGTATALPVYPIQGTIAGTAPSTGVVWNAASPRVTIFADNQAPYGCGIYGWQNGTGTTDGVGPAFLFDPLVAGSFHALDVDPFVLYAPPAASEPFMQTGLGSSADDDHLPIAYVRKGMTGETFARLSPLDYRTNIGLGVPQNLGMNPFDMSQTLLPWMYARLPSTSNTPSWGFYKGIGTMARWVGSTMQTGTLLNFDSVDNAKCVVQATVLPWPTGSVVTI